MITGAFRPAPARIRADLDEARRLKEEVAAPLAEYRRKQQTAEREAAQIAAPAPRLKPTGSGSRPGRAWRSSWFRRTKMAETKIAQAEAGIGRCGARRRRRGRRCSCREDPHQTVKGSVAADLISKGIADLKSKLNWIRRSAVSALLRGSQAFVIRARLLGIAELSTSWLGRSASKDARERACASRLSTSCLLTRRSSRRWDASRQACGHDKPTRVRAPPLEPGRYLKLLHALPCTSAL